MNMRKIGIRTRLIMMSFLLLLIPSLIIGLVSYKLSENALNDSGEILLKNHVNATIELISAMDEQVKAGNISLEDAQERVKQSILGPKQADGKRPINKNLDVGENGYLFIMDKQGVLLAHPTVEGESLWETKDRDGVWVGQEIVKSGLHPGGGFAYYVWPLQTNKDVFEPKITYAKAEEHWGWIVSAGSYLMDYNNAADAILVNVGITLTISLVLGAVICYFFAANIANPITAMASMATKVAQGDLTGESIAVKRSDEIGVLAQNFNHMVDNIKGLLSQVSMASSQVAASSEQLSANASHTSMAAEQVADAMQQMASGATKQVTRLEETNQITSEISKGIDQIAVNIQTVAEASVDASEKANTGTVVVENAIQQMNMIHHKVQAAASVVNQLGDKSNEIGQIVSLITQIAGQTNLLALNAAIEAARAGEQGRGFAVVADEVRKLAEQSSIAANKISALITEIQTDTLRAVDVMDEGTAAVTNGISMVNLSGDSFKEILQAIDEVSGQAQDVSAIVQQVNAGTQEMVTGMDQATEISEKHSRETQSIVRIVSDQVASMEEVTSSSEMLAKMAEELQEIVLKFKL